MRAVGYVILFATDLDASIRFYRDVVGLPLKISEHGYAEFATEGGTKFALFERARAREMFGREAKPGPAGEIVLLTDDADAEAERLRAAGVRILAGPTDRLWGHRTVHVADPDGFVVEFAQEIERQRPRGS